MLGANMRLLDKTVGSVLYRAAKLVRPRENADNDKILVIKLWALGDTVSHLPAITQLREKYPRSEIHVLCTKWNLPIIERCDLFDRIWVLELNPKKALQTARKIRKEGFGIAIDFEPFAKASAALAYYSGAPTRIGFENRKSLYTHPVKVEEKKHIALIFTDLLRPLFLPRVPDKLTNLRPSKKALKWASGFSRGKKIVCLHPGSAGTAETRRWPEDRWIELAKRLSKYDIVIVGGSEETELAKSIASRCGATVLAGKISIDQLIALCYKSRLFIATDSGPMHIAASCGCPTIGLFGPNVPERFGPYCKKCIGIRKSKDPPCILPFRAKFSCGHDHMRSISIDDVMKAASRLLR